MTLFKLSRCLISLLYTLFTLSRLPTTEHSAWISSPVEAHGDLIQRPNFTLIQPEKSQQALFSLSQVSFALTSPDSFSQSPYHIRKSLVLNLNSTNSPTAWLFSLLIISGNVESNPGPPTMRYPCGVCSKPCRKNQKSIQCDTCETWIHEKCAHIDPHNWAILANTSISWHCLNCALPNYSSSLFNSFNQSAPSPNPFQILNSLPEDHPPPSQPPLPTSDLTELQPPRKKHPPPKKHLKKHRPRAETEIGTTSSQT